MQCRDNGGTRGTDGGWVREPVWGEPFGAFLNLYAGEGYDAQILLP